VIVSHILRKIAADVNAEAKRLATQGSMELASAIFNGQGFVPYGPGQYTPTPEAGEEQAQALKQTQPEQSGRDI
jgi:hypothetical protein